MEEIAKLKRDIDKLKRAGPTLESNNGITGLRRLLAELERDLTRTESMHKSMGVGAGAAAAGGSPIIAQRPKANASTEETLTWCLDHFSPENSTQTATLVAHCVLLEHGLKSLEEAPNSVKGFAPSIREVSHANFIPKNWKSSELQYKHPVSKKKYSMSLSPRSDNTGEDVRISSNDNEVEKTFNIDVKGDMDRTITVLRSIATELGLTPSNSNSNTSYASGSSSSSSSLPAAAAASQLHSAAGDISLKPSDRAQSAPSLLAAQSMDIPPNNGSGRVPNGYPDRDGYHHIPPSVGGGDLHPGLGPSPSQPFNPMMGPSSGTNIGPGHPLFTGQNPSDPQSGQGYPHPSQPQPRFDPYGPSGLGPHGPGFMGGVPGGGRGGRGGIGGEPNPDHMMPPGVPGEFDPREEVKDSDSDSDDDRPKKKISIEDEMEVTKAKPKAPAKPKVMTAVSWSPGKLVMPERGEILPTSKKTEFTNIPETETVVVGVDGREDTLLPGDPYHEPAGIDPEDTAARMLLGFMHFLQEGDVTTFAPADRRSWTIHVLQSIEREKFEQTQREQETEEELEQQQLEDKYPGGIPEGHQHHHRQFKSNTARSTAAAAELIGGAKDWRNALLYLRTMYPGAGNYSGVGVELDSAESGLYKRIVEMRTVLGEVVQQQTAKFGQKLKRSRAKAAYRENLIMAARRRAEAEEADKLAREAEEMAEKVRLRLEEEAKMAALRAAKAAKKLAGAADSSDSEEDEEEEDEVDLVNPYASLLGGDAVDEGGEED